MDPATILLALLAAANLAAAQQTRQAYLQQSLRNTHGPYSIDGAVWASYFDDPAYSAHYPFSGPDVSGPYPGNETEGWSVTVAVQSDIPLTNAGERQVDGADREKFIAGVRVTLNPPAKLFNDDDDETQGNWDMDASWRVCYSQFTTYFEAGSAQMRRLADDDGACGSVWNETCRRAIEEAVGEAWGRNNRNVSCPFAIPPGCSPREGSEGWAASHNSLRGGGLRSWRARDSGVGNLRGVQMLGWGSEPGEEGDEGRLELARGFVRPTIIAFGPEDGSKARESRPVVRLVCPRAKEEGEAEVEGGDGRSGGVNAGVQRVVLMLGLAVGAAFCLG